MVKTGKPTDPLEAHSPAILPYMVNSQANKRPYRRLLKNRSGQCLWSPPISAHMHPQTQHTPHIAHYNYSSQGGSLLKKKTKTNNRKSCSFSSLGHSLVKLRSDCPCRIRWLDSYRGIWGLRKTVYRFCWTGAWRNIPVVVTGRYSMRSDFASPFQSILNI